MKEQFQNKLYQFQAEPPADAWDRIASSLESDPDSLFPQKLFEYSEQPPVHIWNTIAENLDENSTPIVPITRRYGRIFRYAGVAAGILVFAFLINIFFNETSVSSGTSSLNVLPQSDPKQTNSQPIEKQNEFTPPPVDTDLLHQSQANLGSKQKRVEKKLARLTFKPGNVPADSRINKVVSTQYPTVQADMLERYILLAQNDGYVIRLSKKLFNLFACPDNKINCKENIQTMQQQIASPTMIASTDFTGMLVMLQNVK